MSGGAYAVKQGYGAYCGRCTACDWKGEPRVQSFHAQADADAHFAATHVPYARRDSSSSSSPVNP